MTTDQLDRSDDAALSGFDIGSLLDDNHHLLIGRRLDGTYRVTRTKTKISERKLGTTLTGFGADLECALGDLKTQIDAGAHQG